MVGIRRAQGYVVWRGNSPEDGAPLVCVATGFLRLVGQSQDWPDGAGVRDPGGREPRGGGEDGAELECVQLVPVAAAVLVKAAKEAAKRAGLPVPELPVCYDEPLWPADGVGDVAEWRIPRGDGGAVQAAVPRPEGAAS